MTASSAVSSRRECLSYKVFGNADAKTVIVFLAGFPDDETSGWGDVLTHLQSSPDKYRLICCCLPDFETAAAGRRRPWGYSIDACVELLERTVDKTVPDPRQRVILCIHDWGSLVGMLYENRNPERVSSALIFDVACSVGPGKAWPLFAGATPFFILILYQLWWSFSYFVGQMLSPRLGEFIFALYSLCVPSFLTPVSVKRGDIPRSRHEVSLEMCYIYYTFWRGMLTSDEVRKRQTPRRLSCPLLFLWGRDKNIMFHNSRFLAHVAQRTDGSRCVGIEGGHWITSGRAGAESIREVDVFLAKMSGTG